MNPGRDVGPLFVHGISNIDVRDAPTFADIAGEILDRLDGAVVVMHDGAFVERFLAAEFARADIELPLDPGAVLAVAGPADPAHPRPTLRTLARHAGRTRSTPPPRSAPSARSPPCCRRCSPCTASRSATCAGCGRCPSATSSATRPAAPSTCARAPTAGCPRCSRAGGSRLPPPGELDAQRYLDTVTEALADGRLLGGEAQTLARLAGSAGLGAAQVEALHGRLLEHLRAAALTDAILTTGQIRQLRTAAARARPADVLRRAAPHLAAGPGGRPLAARAPRRALAPGLSGAGPASFRSARSRATMRR